MSRVYAVEEGSDRRIFVALECDGGGCGERLKPGPDVSESGWIKQGSDHGPGTERTVYDYCPACQRATAR